MGLVSELTTIKEDISDGVVANKVSRFAYKQQAYEDNDADGTDSYDVNQDNNIPNGTASVMKVNQTVIELGWRARASSITRMLMNHFLGRVSYNLNKANDMINSILSNLISYLGTADGIATLDSNAKIKPAQLPKSDVSVNNTDILFTAKGALDYTLSSTTSISWLEKVFGHLLGRWWTYCTTPSSAYLDSFYSLDYGNGIYVISSDNNGLLWSTDAKTWTQGTGTGNNSFRGVKYANGLWVAGAYSGGFWWSEDGKIWTQVTESSDSMTATPYIINYADGLWVAGTSNKALWWSEDGKEWTQGTGITGTYSVSCVKNINGVWYAGTSNNHGLWSSEDGKVWTQLSFGTNKSFSDIIYTKMANTAISMHSSAIMAVGNGGIWESYNGGINWSQTSSTSVSRIVYGRGVAVVTGGSSGIYYNYTGGSSWQSATISGSPSTSFTALAYANGVFLAGSDSYGVYRSVDGINWEQVTSNRGISVIKYINHIWIIGGYYNGSLNSVLGYSDWDKLEDGQYFTVSE